MDRVVPGLDVESLRASRALLTASLTSAVDGAEDSPDVMAAVMLQQFGGARTLASLAYQADQLARSLARDAGAFEWSILRRAVEVRVELAERRGWDELASREGPLPEFAGLAHARPGPTPETVVALSQVLWDRHGLPAIAAGVQILGQLLEDVAREARTSPLGALQALALSQETHWGDGSRVPA